MRKMYVVFFIACLLAMLNGCGVSESDYNQLASELAAVKQELLQTQKELNTLGKELTALTEENKILKTQIDKYKLEVKRLKAAAAAKPSSAEKQTVTKKPRVYIVKPGDTLWNISRTSGVSVDALKKINNIKDASIKVGQELLLP